MLGAHGGVLCNPTHNGARAGDASEYPRGMTWQDAVAFVSSGVSIVVALLLALSRETTGELKRRLTALEAASSLLPNKDTVSEVHRRLSSLETKDETRTREIAHLDERSNGMTESLKRIEQQMVPRAEWEARHEATDAMLERILSALDSRVIEPAPNGRRKVLRSSYGPYVASPSHEPKGVGSVLGDRRRRGDEPRREGDGL